MNLFEGLPAFVLDVHSAQYARIVHKYLNRPEQGESRPEYIVPSRRRVSHVIISQRELSPDTATREDSTSSQDIAGNYKCTSRHEPLHDRPPLSSRGAGNDRDPSVELRGLPGAASHRRHRQPTMTAW